MPATSRTAFALLIATGLAGPALVAGQDSHQHGEHHAAAHEHAHDGHGAPALQLDDGQRWQTDESLREGMQRIRDALAVAHAAHAGQPTLDAADGRALAAAIDAAIGHMVANCKLSPEADANLHVLLGRLGQASGELKQDPTSTRTADTIGAALDAYALHFDHPGWSTDAHAH